jgi:uncharacterized protein YfaS (alpha-2-macroglobulin family)
VRGALERQVRGHWGTTTANAWAIVALDGYAKRFERETVSGRTKAQLGNAKAEHVWGNAKDTPVLSLPWPAANNTLSVTHEGAGKPWLNLQTLAAIPLTAPRGQGYRLIREVTPVQEKEAGRVRRGDVWRVTVTIDAAQDMTWVVLSDPIPGGARILGEGDGRDARLSESGGSEPTNPRGLSPSHVERSFSGYRAYYEVMPRGRHRVSYTVRLNNAGEFGLPASRIEAMYAPELFAEIPNSTVVIQP